MVSRKQSSIVWAWVAATTVVLLCSVNAAAAFQAPTTPRHRSPWNQQPSEGVTNRQNHESGTKCTDDRRAVLSKLLAPVLAALTAGASLPPTNALSPKDAADIYDSYAPNYDELDGGKAASLFGIDEGRTELIGKATGNVLEIGVGTGLNLEKYNLRKVTSFTFVDISDGMINEAKHRVASIEKLRGIPVKFVKADATSQLAQTFGPESFDTVVDTFSLCVFGNEGAKRCLEEIKQVVKKKEGGGRVLLLENSRSSNPVFGLYQDATADAAASMGGKGCVMNQNVEKLVRDAGISIEVEKSYAAGLFRSFVCTVQ